MFRLSWEEAEAPGADRRRAVPSGSYELVGYRLIRADAEGTTWHLSATGPKGRAIEIRPGKETEIALEPAIRIGKHIQGERLQVAIQGEGKLGLSIYRAGKRVPITFELLDVQGRVLEAGKIEYG